MLARCCPAGQVWVGRPPPPAAWAPSKRKWPADIDSANSAVKMTRNGTDATAFLPLLFTMSSHFRILRRLHTILPSDTPARRKVRAFVKLSRCPTQMTIGIFMFFRIVRGVSRAVRTKNWANDHALRLIPAKQNG